MSLLTATLAQLRGYTRAQIVTALDNKFAVMTKKQLILMLLFLQGYNTDDDPEVPDDRQFTYHSNGQWETCLEVARDALGAKRRSVGVRRTFTADTSVDKIVTIDYDAADVAQRRVTIQYYHDGRQPTVTVEV